VGKTVDLRTKLADKVRTLPVGWHAIIRTVNVACMSIKLCTVEC